MASTTDTPEASSDAEPRALLSQLNWLRVSADETDTPIYEYPLYSDAHITGEVTDAARRLLDAYAGLTARDALHAAVCRLNQAEAWCSYDRDFDAIAGVERREPEHFLQD